MSGFLSQSPILGGGEKKGYPCIFFTLLKETDTSRYHHFLITRGLFRTMSNISDRAFFEKSYQLTLVIYN